MRKCKKEESGISVGVVGVVVIVVVVIVVVEVVVVVVNGNLLNSTSASYSTRPF